VHYSQQQKCLAYFKLVQTLLNHSEIILPNPRIPAANNDFRSPIQEALIVYPVVLSNAFEPENISEPACMLCTTKLSLKPLLE
jgi:hypothetical protein